MLGEECFGTPLRTHTSGRLEASSPVVNVPPLTMTRGHKDLEYRKITILCALRCNDKDHDKKNAGSVTSRYAKF